MVISNIYYNFIIIIIIIIIWVFTDFVVVN